TPRLRVQQECRDLRAMLAAVPEGALEPEGALVVPVQRVLPGEADATVRLDRLLACEHRSLRSLRFRGRDGELGLVVSFGDRPRSPVGERAGQLNRGVA